MIFKDKMVIITGGSSGLGKALAHRLWKKGASIALIARDEQKLVAVRDELWPGLPGKSDSWANL